MPSSVGNVLVVEAPIDGAELVGKSERHVCQTLSWFLGVRHSTRGEELDTSEDSIPTQLRITDPKTNDAMRCADVDAEPLRRCNGMLDAGFNSRFAWPA